MSPSEALSRDQAIQLLLQHRQKLAQLYVASLGIFGSVARNQAGPESDVDILVCFNRPVGYFHVVRVQKFLESVLNRPVDLVLEDALRAEFRESIMKELVRAA